MDTSADLSSCYPTRLLSEGVPLTLLIDLFFPAALDSREIYASEPADTSWLRTSAAA